MKPGYLDKTHPIRFGDGWRLTRVQMRENLSKFVLRTFYPSQILRVNTKYNVIWIRGPSVPGEVGNYVIVYDTILPTYKRGEAKKNYFPTFFPSEEEAIAEDQFDEILHNFASPSITFAQDDKEL